MQKRPVHMFAPEGEPEGLQNSVGLLISILVRYPEVGTVKYQPEEKSLRFTFMISGLVDEDTFRTFANRLRESLLTFSFVGGRRMRVCLLEKTEYNGFTLIELHRDVESLSREEISLIASLLGESFADRVVREAQEPLLEEDQLYQEELIEHMLDDIRQGQVTKDLIGFRENGRVFVFDKADPWSRRRE
ncbi:MAG: hypothetical protein QME79_08195 [Bacillota bacterium]|nr:hypothetical protein [Bacillota bacterium]